MWSKSANSNLRIISALEIQLLLMLSPERDWAHRGAASGWPIVWVLDFMKERFPTTSLGAFESTSVKSGDGATNEGIRIEEATGERLGGLPWSSRNITRKNRATLGCVDSLRDTVTMTNVSHWDLPGMSRCCPLLPWLEISWDPWSLREKKAYAWESGEKGLRVL